MKYVRILFEGKAHWGELFKTTIHVLDKAPYAGGSWIGRKIELNDAVILAPCEPSKIVAVGKNYHDHIKEFDAQIPDRPILFIKPSSAIQDPQKPIVLPSPNLTQRVDYEGELALVIGKTASHIQADQAADYILGYTILNDVTARDIQKLDGQWTRAKSFDTFAPIGPILTDEVDPADLQITTTLNGHVRQQESTAHLIWNIGELLAFITQVMTLQPGDVVTTGTPAGVGR
jgi:2-keto-4-pentenoate hydratase/2-oxohepta-3-ene-1,7-dioic acid hydratase in catechol pathway